jgi:hypothetical protein
MKPMLRAPGSKRLKLEYDKLLSSFAFKFNLRRYNEDKQPTVTNIRTHQFSVWPARGPFSGNTEVTVTGRGLHSLTFQFNLSRI